MQSLLTYSRARRRRYHTVVYGSSWVVIEIEPSSVWFTAAVATTGKPIDVVVVVIVVYNVTCLRDNRTRIYHGHIIKFHLHSMYYLFTRGNSFKVVVFIFGSFPISATFWYRYRRSAFTNEYYLNSPVMICTL